MVVTINGSTVDAENEIIEVFNKNDELSSLNENIMSENNVLTGLFKNAEEKNLLLEAENETIKKTNEDLWKRGASISGRSLKKLRDSEAGSFLYDFQKKSQ